MSSRQFTVKKSGAQREDRAPTSWAPTSGSGPGLLTADWVVEGPMGLWWERAKLAAGGNTDWRLGDLRVREAYRSRGRDAKARSGAGGTQATSAEPGCGLAQRAGWSQEAGHQSRSRAAKGYPLSPAQRPRGFPCLTWAPCCLRPYMFTFQTPFLLSPLRPSLLSPQHISGSSQS